MPKALQIIIAHPKDPIFLLSKRKKKEVKDRTTSYTHLFFRPFVFVENIFFPFGQGRNVNRCLKGGREFRNKTGHSFRPRIK